MTAKCLQSAALRPLVRTQPMDVGAKLYWHHRDYTVTKVKVLPNGRYKIYLV